MRRILIALFPLFLLAACGAEPMWAPDADVQRAEVYWDGPKSVTLVTVISNRNGSGAHSGLLINASQRVIFDPAGTFKVPGMPERNDVLFGLTDVRKEIYLDYHARVTYHVVTQEVAVSPETAELLLQKVENNGAVNKAYCANSISSLLSTVPQFSTIHRTFFPVSLMKEFSHILRVYSKPHFSVAYFNIVSLSSCLLNITSPLTFHGFLCSELIQICPLRSLMPNQLFAARKFCSKKHLPLVLLSLILLRMSSSRLQTYSLA